MRTRGPGSLPAVIQLIVVVVIFAVALVGFFAWSAIGHNATPAIAQATPEPLPSGFFKPTEEQWQSLTTVPVRSASFGDDSYSDGTIAPADDTTTQIFSPFTGRVTNVYATVGDYVHKGDPVFAGEGGEYAQAVNDLATAQESLSAARTQLHITEVNRARLLKLLRVDGVARKDVEQSKADVATALATVRNDEIAVALVQSRIRVLGESEPHGAPVNGRPAQGALPTTVTVRAPIDGIVTQRAVGVGQFIDSAANGSSNALLTITGLERVFFVANVTETEIARIHIGDPVSVSMIAFPGRIFDARVKYIAPNLDPNSHRIAVRAEVDNPGDALKPGMFGTFRIRIGAASSELGVPEDAVIFEGDTARVWIVGPNHTLALRYITAGKTSDGIVEVLRGLRAGDRIVTTGSVFIDRAAQGDN
jgi:cobalt-zinc-cadmium efflux system membrane fusion protein